jgi:uncharacterized membrane protein
MTDPTVEAYLKELRALLGPMRLSEREEIVREIEAHLRDALELPGATAQAELARLGPAAKLAAEYRDGMLIRRASQSFSPLLLVRASLRLATRGVSGVAVFFLAIFGYSLGGGLVVTALAKGIFPANTGLWIEDGRLVASGTIFPAPPLPAHEVLGWMYIALALTAGSLLMLMTSAAIRNLLRVSGQVQSRL